MSEQSPESERGAAPTTSSRRAFVIGAAVSAGAAAALVGPSAIATFAAPVLQTAGGTLDEIQKRGTLRTATFLNYPPFGSRDQQNNPIGYDVDIGAEMAKALGVKHEIIEVTTPGARIPTVVTGGVSFADSRAHAPNESIRLDDFKAAIRYWGRFFSRLADS